MSDSAPSPLPRILLIEDSNIASAIVSRCLRDHYEVLRAADGEQAWDMLGTDSLIELVIADVEMPRLDGYGLLAKIRTAERPSLQGLPVILMTAADGETDRRRAFAGGASDFVVKPIEPIELRTRVRLHQQLSRAMRDLAANHALIDEQAGRDSLTRLKNRGTFVEIGRRQFAAARRHRRGLSVVMLDIDHLEKINDAYGRSAGDRVLMSVAQVIATTTRAGDTRARIGAAAFALLLLNTNRAAAARVAERMRSALEESSGAVAAGSVTVTASAGVACSGTDSVENLDQLMALADQRLQVAKRNGRNRVVAGH